MKRLAGFFMLVAFSFAVLLMGGIGEHHEPEHYFRDNTGARGAFIYMFCGNGNESIQQRSFAEQYEQLCARGILPALSQELRYLESYYHPGDKLGLISLGVGDVAAYIYPPDSSLIDSRYEVDAEVCTRTEVNGITVYGDGTVDSEMKALTMELKDGTRCYIVGQNYADPLDMVQLAEHYVNHGVRFDAFSMEKGDHYEHVGLEDPRTMEFAHGCIPETLEIYEAILELKNDAPNRAVFHYSLGVGKDLTWVVLPGYDDLYKGPDMGDISDLTQETLAAHFGEKSSGAGFWCNGKYIYVIVGKKDLADELWELIRLIQEGGIYREE